MRLISFACLISFSSNSLFAQTPTGINTRWDPVTDSDRNLSAPLVDKNVGAEAIFWKVHVVDDYLNNVEPRRTLYHYVRLKLFNQKGVEDASSIDIRYDERTTVTGIAGRTVKRDGTIVELAKDAVHERDLVRLGSHRRRAKSFAMPGLEPGAIVEYRWKELIDVENMLYLALQLQREYPVQRVTYFIKPLSFDDTGLRMATWPFNCRPAPLQLDNLGYHTTFLENVPAFHEEPFMPGEPNIRAWMLLRYQEEGKREPEKYWTDIGKKSYQELKVAIKVNDEIRAAAQSAVEGAPEEEKAVRLIRYVRKNFRNLNEDTVTEAERSAVLKSMPKDRWRSAPEVFKSRLGTADELNALVAALALAVDVEARPARVASRDGLVFNRSLAEQYFLPHIDLAVRHGENWKLYDVSATSLPANMLGWREEGMEALLSDPKKPQFIASPLSAPGASSALRSAKFRLAEDGTLEGDVEERFTGHRGAQIREEYLGESEARQQEILKENLLAAHPGAEVTAPHLENVAGADEPLRVTYHIRIPGYATVTGKRLFFQPAFFRRGIPPLLTSTERNYDIHFQYAWDDSDVVEMQLPAGFTLDSPESPGNMDFGTVGQYVLNLEVSAGGLLRCTRKLTFGNAQHIAFPKASYASLKAAFGEIHRRDNLSLAIKQAQPLVSGR